MNNKKGNGHEEIKPKSHRKRAKHPILAFFIFMISLFLGIFILAGTFATLYPVHKNAEQAPPSSIGTTVSDAGFNFVVNSFKCGETHVSTGVGLVASEDAQGQFCRLNITVTNTGNTSNNIRAYNQYLFNVKGQKFEYNAHATSIAAGNYIGTELNDDINPSNSITNDVVFDVPAGDAPTIAELHGDSDSLGVRIKLQ